MNERIAKLEVKRERLHDYIRIKLDDRDYHAIADAAMDLRELDVEVKLMLLAEDLIGIDLSKGIKNDK